LDQHMCPPPTEIQVSSNIPVYQNFFIHQLMHKWIVLKTILKFTLKLTLKQLRHVSVQSPSSESVLFDQTDSDQYTVHTLTRT
jgi:hypothetical protein